MAIRSTYCSLQGSGSTHSADTRQLITVNSAFPGIYMSHSYPIESTTTIFLNQSTSNYILSPYPYAAHSRRKLFCSTQKPLQTTTGHNA